MGLDKSYTGEWYPGKTENLQPDERGVAKERPFCLLMLLGSWILERIKVTDLEMKIITEKRGRQVRSLLKGMWFPRVTHQVDSEKPQTEPKSLTEPCSPGTEIFPHEKVQSELLFNKTFKKKTKGNIQALQLPSLSSSWGPHFWDVG